MSANNENTNFNHKKQKCDKLLNKIFGSNFYFVHATGDLKSILKSGKIKISSKINKDDRSFTFATDNPHPYAYCIAIYDDIPLNVVNNVSIYSLLIDPRILLNEDIIFNSGWWAEPIDIKKQTNKIFSIYLNKSDSKEDRLKKLQKIKNYIETHEYVTKDNGKFYYNLHEFLFCKNINLKKYLIGIVRSDYRSNHDILEMKLITKIINKKYHNVKIYERVPNETLYYPKLLDVIC